MLSEKLPLIFFDYFEIIGSISKLAKLLSLISNADFSILNNYIYCFFNFCIILDDFLADSM